MITASGKAKFVLLLSLYATQYMGYSFLIEATIIILRKNDMPLKFLGIVYFLSVFWLIKFTFAPFIDRIRLTKRIGHYKSWLLLFQAMLILCTLLISQYSLVNELFYVSVLSIFISFFSALQSVASDGLAYRLISEEELSMGNAMKVAGSLMGYMLGGGVTLIVYSYLGWFWCMMFVSAITAIPLIMLYFLVEPEYEYTKSKKAIKYALHFFTFWSHRDRKKWLLLLCTYPLSIGVTYSLVHPLLVDLGWSLERIGLVVNIIGAIAGALGAMFAGFLAGRYGIKRLMISAIFLQSVIIIFLLMSINGSRDTSTLSLLITLMIFGYSISGTVISTIMMDKSSAETPATDYSIQDAVYRAVTFLFGGVSIYFAGIYSYSAGIMVALGISAVSFFIVLWYYGNDSRLSDFNSIFKSEV